MDHSPIHASRLVGHWARTAYAKEGSLSYAREIVFIKSVSGRSVDTIDSSGELDLLDEGVSFGPTTNWASGWTQISIQEDALKFLGNRVRLIKDDKVAGACKIALKNLTKCFAQTIRNTKPDVFNWPHEVKFEPSHVYKYQLPSLPDSLPLKALADWCETNCIEATADVRVLQDAFGDFEITKENYIPRPSAKAVSAYARCTNEWGD